MNTNFFRDSVFSKSTFARLTAAIGGIPVGILNSVNTRSIKRLSRISAVIAMMLVPVLTEAAYGRSMAVADADEPIRPQTTCPDQLEELMPLLLRDLPSYANRVSQRAYTNYRTREVPGYVLLAGRPEYEPLTLAAGEYTSTSESKVPQVFFTTLERQYFSQDAFRLQHYHWLFLTQTENGWRFVLMQSAVGNDAADEPPTPPRDSSRGVIAQAIRLWLRDCAAGSIAP